jgi:ABC-type transport system involved in cytochrome bd biosynthesis fused ATPase/permease subunit
VPQKPYIEDTSILQNICFGIPFEEIDENRVAQLLEEVDLYDWVTTLPQKGHTIIGEDGSRISGGQKQRLALARALYPDPEVLILDEVTSHLDKQTEQDVLNTLLKITKKEKTIILVTHKQELWRQFDSVYELKNGNLNALSLQPEVLKS